MNGPEHYREAERLTAQVRQTLDNFGDREVELEIAAGIKQSIANQIAEAQVHATLALAAATAYPAIRDHCGDESNESRGWAAVTA